MSRRPILVIALTILLALAALIFLAAAFLPFPLLKALAGLLVSDGNFKSLNVGNAIIFRIILVTVGLTFVAASIGVGGGYIHNILGWFHQYFINLKSFFKDLKPTKVEIFALGMMLMILTAAVILRLFHIYEPITHDEGYTFVVFSSTSLFNILTNYQLPNNHILNSLLIYFSTYFFGSQPWAVRLPALLAGLLLIPATYVLAKQIYNKYTAILSAVLITILPGAILYSTRARGYSLVALFTVVSMSIASYVKENKNLFAWSLLVLFSALGFYSNPVMLFPFGIVFVWLFFENLFSLPGPYRSKFNFLKYWFFAGISTATIVLILYTPIFIYSGSDKVFANPWVTPQPWTGFIASVPARVSEVWHEWIVGLHPFWVIILVVGFCLSIILHRRIARSKFPLQIAAFLWLAVLVLLQRPEPVTKVWSFLQAPFVIWSAAGIIGLIKILPVKFTSRVPIAGVVVAAAVLIVLVGAIKLVPQIHAHWNEKGPEEKTVQAIKEQLNTDDLIIIDSPYDAATWYYSELYGLSKSYFNKNLPFNHLFVIVSPSEGQTLQSVIKFRGPDLSLTDLDASHLAMNYGYLDTYIVPHR